MTSKTKPAWVGQGIAVWDWGEKISIKIVGHDFIEARKVDKEQEQQTQNTTSG
tara:strand:- start:668 stop:826 length:159 start_codon:yes stop_codon:yes gene_type:complete